MPRLQVSLIDLRNSCSIPNYRPKIYGHFKKLKKKYSSKHMLRLLLAVFGVSGTAMLHDRKTHPHPDGRDGVM